MLKKEILSKVTNKILEVGTKIASHRSIPSLGNHNYILDENFEILGPLKEELKSGLKLVSFGPKKHLQTVQKPIVKQTLPEEDVAFADLENSERDNLNELDIKKNNELKLMRLKAQRLQNDLRSLQEELKKIESRGNQLIDIKRIKQKIVSDIIQADPNKDNPQTLARKKEIERKIEALKRQLSAMGLKDEELNNKIHKKRKIVRSESFEVKRKQFILKRHTKLSKREYPLTLSDLKHGLSAHDVNQYVYETGVKSEDCDFELPTDNNALDFTLDKKLKNIKLSQSQLIKMKTKNFLAHRAQMDEQSRIGLNKKLMVGEHELRKRYILCCCFFKIKKIQNAYMIILVNDIISSANFATLAYIISLDLLYAFPGVSFFILSTFTYVQWRVENNIFGQLNKIYLVCRWIFYLFMTLPYARILYQILPIIWGGKQLQDADISPSEKQWLTLFSLNKILIMAFILLLTLVYCLANLYWNVVMFNILQDWEAMKDNEVLDMKDNLEYAFEKLSLRNLQNVRQWDRFYKGALIDAVMGSQENMAKRRNLFRKMRKKETLIKELRSKRKKLRKRATIHNEAHHKAIIKDLLEHTSMGHKTPKYGNLLTVGLRRAKKTQSRTPLARKRTFNTGNFIKAVNIVYDLKRRLTPRANPLKSPKINKRSRYVNEVVLTNKNKSYYTRNEEREEPLKYEYLWFTDNEYSSLVKENDKTLVN